MKRGRRPAISELQAKILLLRDEQTLSWPKIAVEVGITKGNCAKLYKRARKVLADRAAAQAAWEKAEGTRFTEAHWWRLSKANRRRWASRAPFPPEIMAGLTRPKRPRSDRRWDRPDNPLAGQSEEQRETAPEPRPGPIAPAPVPQLVAPGPVATPVPVSLPATPNPQRTSKHIFVFNWSLVDGLGIHDAEGNPVTDSKPFTVLTVHRVEEGFELRFEGKPETLCMADGRRLVLTFDAVRHHVMGTIEPAWRVPSAQEIFVWNTGPGQMPIYRRADGTIVTDYVEGDGPRKGRIFRITNDDPIALAKDRSLQRDADEFLVYRVYHCAGVFTASREGKSFELELQRPCLRTGLDWESDQDFLRRKDKSRPHQYWLPVLRLAPARESAKFLPSPWHIDPSARALQIARTAFANSRSREIKQRDAEHQQQRQQRQEREPTEDDYFRGIGF